MAIVRLAFLSVLNRRVTAGLTLLAIALSIAMLLGVEKVRRDARGSFASTISGTDLIVGARSGAIQLLLYSVFRIGNATNNISWQSYREIADFPRVRWTVPIALGDSHRGFRVMGTSEGYFEHYRYARTESLEFAVGGVFDDVFDAVLGAEVAERLGYALGDSLIVAHGTGDVSFIEHDDKPFRVAGILTPTGTPVDRTVHVSLQGYTAMHVDWAAGVPIPGVRISAEEARTMDLTPETITAFLVGLDSKIAIFGVQRRINEYREEPLLAIIPGVALQELWDLMSVAENVLRVVSSMVVVTGLLGMLTVILSSLEARRREMAVLRSVGARPLHVFALFMSEAGVLALLGAAAGVVLLYVALLVGQPIVTREFGLHLPLAMPAPADWWIIAAVVGAGFAAGSIPAFRAYRLSLADGLSMRI
ncbi:MAG: ABC transporter permease [Thiotrichales bacterium]|nr:ABC transporter permease [Thiotrichales bacterium]MCY4285051.1 ABC transporter permease [Thiotrichales bacterium]MCY4350420.1 ABC transporter permease [Thiotrichales bacterium]